MSHMLRRPPGYLTKAEAAERLGFSQKTLDRRMKTEPCLARALRIGQRVWLREDDISAYFKRSQDRGYL